MTDLPHAAQTVLDALYMDELNGPQQLMARAHAIAALRAAAVYCKRDRVQLFAIADELEAVST
jgi:hypothetical protein